MRDRYNNEVIIYSYTYRARSRYKQILNGPISIILTPRRHAPPHAREGASKSWCTDRLPAY